MATECTVPVTDPVTTIAKGDAVCVTGFDTANNRKPATRANLGASRTVFGVAENGAAGGGSVFVRVAGEVAENAITGLGAGGSRIVATDINNNNPPADEHECQLIRIDRPDGSEYVVGTCDENGNLVVQPRASHDTSPQHVYNVKSYGAVGDGKYFVDANMVFGSAILHSATALFTLADQGKNIRVIGAGVGGADLVTTISGFTNATTVTLATAASTAVPNAALPNPPATTHAR